MLWSLSQIQWAAESTGDGSGDSQLCGESTGHSAADKSCVCLAGLISSLFIWPWPFFYTSSDLRLNTADYVWSRRYFRSTSSHRWSIKLIFSALNSPLITLPLAPPLSLMQRSSSPPPLPPALLINIFRHKCVLFQQHRVASAWDEIRIKDIDHTGPDDGVINNS